MGGGQGFFNYCVTFGWEYIPENQSTTRQSDYDRVLEVSEPNAVKGQGAG